jgi:hypothetical protein
MPDLLTRPDDLLPAAFAWLAMMWRSGPDAFSGPNGVFIATKRCLVACLGVGHSAKSGRAPDDRRRQGKREGDASLRPHGVIVVASQPIS